MVTISENLLRSVFHTLAYADVFDYPLTVPETHRYLTSARASLAEVSRVLQAQFPPVGEFYTLPGREHIVEIRKRRGEVSAHLWRKALGYGRLLAGLPFVRMVAVTGSLAMNNTDEGRDIDYMIVTAPNRLWTCRALSLLVAHFAKLEGVNLCPNYLVTTNALELKERSLYVAHELTQMIPLSGMDVYHELRRLNDWVDEYLPNASGAPAAMQPIKLFDRQAFVQECWEVVFRLPFGDWLEKWEMSRKIRRLSQEQSSSFESYFSADICKGHIDRHGENLVRALAIRIEKTVVNAVTTETA